VGRVDLLARARAAGLKVAERDGRLWISGPLHHEPLALQLIKAKAVILGALREESDESRFPVPTSPCRCCGAREFWRRAHGHWLCRACHPAPSRDVVASQCEAEILEEVGSGLPAGLEALLHRHHWEPVASVRRSVAMSVARAKEANDANEAIVATPVSTNVD